MRRSPPDVDSDPFESALRDVGDGPEREVAVLALAQRYSYVLPDPQSLTTLANLAPLVEMGAGTGYWASKLRDIGIDVIAYDQTPPDSGTPNRYHGTTPTWTEVLAGDCALLERHSDRTLFLCWPPLFSSLGDCLGHYLGNTVVCIGDGGRRTARLRTLAERFECIEVHPVAALDPEPGAPATMSVWRRVVASSA
jgi:hypothetical protein